MAGPKEVECGVIATTRDASGGRGTTAVEGEERKPDAREDAGQKTLEPPPRDPP